MENEKELPGSWRTMANSNREQRMRQFLPESPLPPGLVAFTRSACGGFKIILSETAISHSSFLFLNNVIYLRLWWVFIAVLALSLVVASRSYSLVATQGLLTTVAPLVVEQGLQAHSFSSCSMWALELGLSCSLACGIFPDQGLNWCPLYCKADS